MRYVGISTYQFIPCYASGAIHKHSHTHILKPFEDSEPTGLNETSVWDPYTTKNISKTEAVQRRAARWVVNRHRQTSSVGEMWTGPHWTNADEGATRLTTTFKFHRGKVVMNTTRKPVPSLPTRLTRSTHHEAYLLPACRTQYRQKSFFPRTIAEWNALPLVAVQSAMVEAFKNLI